jgi:hypothetical protein
MHHRISHRFLCCCKRLMLRPGSCVGASLLAIAVGQSMKVLAVVPSSRAGSLPQVFVSLRYFMFRRSSNVGASLLAKAVGQSMKVLAVVPSSRAGSLVW